MNAVIKSIEVPGGGRIVLLDRLAKKSIFGVVECARNACMLNSKRQRECQLVSDFDNNGGSFTNILLDGGGMKGYRLYEVIYKLI